MIEIMVQNIQDLNTVAKYLRDKQEFDRIKELAYEWLVPDDYVNDFIAGKRVLLADIDIGAKEYGNAHEKVADEMELIGDPDFANVIGLYICKMCADKEYEALVLQPHKALQKCLDYILEKVYKIAEEQHGKNGMRRQGGVGTAMTSTKVFAWVDEYYALDDAKEEAEKKEKAKQEFIKNRKKAEERAKTRKKEEAEWKERQAKKTQISEAKKKAEENQMSIFDLMQDGDQKKVKDISAPVVKEEQKPDQNDSSDKTSKSETEAPKDGETGEFDESV